MISSGLLRILKTLARLVSAAQSTSTLIELALSVSCTDLLVLLLPVFDLHLPVGLGLGQLV